MISSLCIPGKVSRMLVESRGLPGNSICILKAESRKVDIKRREPGILFKNWVGKEFSTCTEKMFSVIKG